MNEFNHVHFGPGSLGLGLAVDRSAAEPRVSTTVVGRTNGSNPEVGSRLQRDRRFTLLVDGTEREIEFERFLASNDAHDRELLTDCFRSEPPLLVTTAVRDGQRATANLLAPLLAERRSERPDAPTFIVPCENLVDRSIEDLDRYSGSEQSRLVLPAMVDRMCEPVDVVGDRVVVEAEPYSRWIVADPRDDGGVRDVLGEFEGLLGFELREDFREQKDLKFLLLNGTHACFAILAVLFKHDELSGFANTEYGRGVLVSLLLEYSLVMKFRYPDFPTELIDQTSSDFEQRIANYEKRVAAVARRLTPETRAAAFHDLAPKIAGPLVELMALSGSTEQLDFTIGWAFDELVYLWNNGFDVRDFKS